MLKIYNKEHEATGALTNLKDYKIEYLLSGEDSLEFSLSRYDENIHLVEEEGYIRTKHNEYIVKEVDPSDNFKRFACIVNVEAIKGKSIANFDTSNNMIDDTIKLALAGTGWLVVDSGITKRRTVRLKNTNALEVLREARKVFRVDYKFDALNKKIYVYENRGSDKGVYFSDELNLISLDIPSDTYDYATRIIPTGKDGLDIKSVNGGKNYVENLQYSKKIMEVIWEDGRYTDANSLKEDAQAKLDELSKPKRSYQVQVYDLAKNNSEYSFLDFEIGDTVTILSNLEKFRDKQRIVKYIEYPEEPNRNTCELGNTMLTFEEIQKENEYKNQVIDNITSDNGTVDGSTVDEITTEQIKDFDNKVIKVVDIEAINGKFENLIANNVTITGELNAVKANIGTLTANVANIDKLVVNHTAEIKNLIATTATITDLNATNATIENLKVNVASIETLLAGNITAGNIAAGTITVKELAAGTITAGSGVIADGAIGNAHISNLDAVKINAGTIDTSKVTVAGPNSNLRLRGNRLQVFTGIGNNQIERVSLGDVLGDGSKYGLLIRGADGKTVIMDENGVKSAGITNGSITNDKVSGDANIDGAKLNINSVVTKINGATTSILGTKIDINGTNLSAKLSQQDTTIKDNKTIIDSHSTSIVANTNAIKLKVDNQTYTTDKTNMTNTLNKHTSDISLLNNQITLKVEQTDITNAIKDIEIGTRNILENSSFSNDFTKWGLYTTSANIDIITIDNLKCAHINQTELKTTKYVKQSIHGKIKSNKKYTISGWCRCNLTELGTTNRTNMLYSSGVDKDGDWFSPISSKEIPNNNKWTYVTWSITAHASCDSSRNIEFFVHMRDVIGDIYFYNLKIEEGTKPSSWTPAPEDIDSNIDSKVSTAKAEIKITTDAISQNVTNLTTTVSTKADGTKVTTLSNKVSSLETGINGIKGQVSSLETTTTKHTTDISKAQTDANTANSLASTNKGNIGTLTTEVTNTKNQVASIETNLNGITQRVSNTESTTATLTEQVCSVTNTANNSVKSVDVMYYLSTSQTSLVGGSWVTTAPTWVNGKYMWSKTKTTLSNGTVKESSPTCIAGAKGDNGSSGITHYTWIRYADNINGGGLSSNATGKTYIGIAYNKTTNTPSNTPTDYTWSLIKGTDGIPGTNGIDGKTYYTWLKYADSPTTGMSDSPTNKKYMGLAYNRTTATESTNYNDYSWSLIKGTDGSNGSNGITYYTWVRYADNSSGGGISSSPTNKTYIGLSYNKTSNNPTNTPTDYAWSLIKGSDGIAGVNGVDGKTYYTWVKYADSPTSGITDNPNGKKYVGLAYNKTTSTESNNYNDYAWSLIKGSDGTNGANGQGITSITEEYYLSTSKTTQTGGSWVTIPPTWSSGKYMWTRSKIIYNNPTKTEYTTPIVDSSWEAVNDIQIGGRNILPSSKDFAKRWNLNFGGVGTGIDGNKSIINKRRDYTESTRQQIAVTNIPIIKKGDNVTLSGYYYINNAIVIDSQSSNEIALRVYKPDGSFADKNVFGFDIKKTNQWIYFSVTSKIDVDIKQIDLLFSLSKNGHIEITKPKVEIGNRATDWTPSIEDVDEYIGDAKKQGTDALNKHSDMANDNKITPVEKQATKKEWDIIVGEKAKIASEATKLSIGTEKTNYETKYNNLNTYITPILSSLTTTTDINGVTHRAKFKEYYDSRQDLLNAISSKLKAIGDNAQNDANQNKTEITTTKNKVASIETTVNGITSKVTNLESTTVTIDGKVTAMDTRLKSAESKITEDAITNTVKKQFYTKNEVESKGYQTESQVQQTVDKLEIKFEESGGYNLLYNGDFKRGLDKWRTSGTVTYRANGLASPKGRGIQLGNGLGTSHHFSQIIDNLGEFIHPITLTYYTYLSSSGANGTTNPFTSIEVSLKYTDNTKSYNSIGIPSTFDKWTKMKMTLNPTKRVKTIGVLALCRDTTKTLYFSDIMIEKGTTANDWSPNPNEVYDGITTIDKDGITVTASNVKSKTSMTADGFKITKTDTNEDVFKVNSDGTLYIKGNITATNKISGNSIEGGTIKGVSLQTYPNDSSKGVRIGAESLQLNNTSLFYQNNNFKIEAKENMSISSMANIALMPGLLSNGSPSGNGVVTINGTLSCNKLQVPSLGNANMDSFTSKGTSYIKDSSNNSNIVLASNGNVTCKAISANSLNSSGAVVVTSSVTGTTIVSTNGGTCRLGQYTYVTSPANMNLCGIYINGAVVNGTSSGNIHVTNTNGNYTTIYSTNHKSIINIDVNQLKIDNVKALDYIDMLNVNISGEKCCVYPKSKSTSNIDKFISMVSLNEKSLEKYIEMDTTNTVMLLVKAVQELKEILYIKG